MSAGLEAPRRTPGSLTGLITAADADVRDRALDAWAAGCSTAELLAAAGELDRYRHEEDNLYHRVRALFFLYALHRFHLPARPDFPTGGKIPYRGYAHLLERRFE